MVDELKVTRQRGGNHHPLSVTGFIIDHLDNWQFSLAEMVRVADNVVVVLPDPIYFSGWLSPSHEQHFSVEEINEIAELYPEVTVYY